MADQYKNYYGLLKSTFQLKWLFFLLLVHLLLISSIQSTAFYTSPHKQHLVITRVLWPRQRNHLKSSREVGSPFSWQTVRLPTCHMPGVFWDLNGPIITTLEQINGDLPARALSTMGDGEGVTRCTETLWTGWQEQPLRQKSVFLQKVRLWQEAINKVPGLLF